MDSSEIPNNPEDIKNLTSCFEVIEFSLLRNGRNGEKIQGVYGVNVAKVREVIRLPKINPLASRIEGLAGIFELRGVPIPAVNLNHILGDTDFHPQSSNQIIVTEFSGKRAGFIVHATHRIRRVTWDKVLPPSSDVGSCISGMILVENNEFLFILDLERILGDLELKASGGVATSSWDNYQQLIHRSPYREENAPWLLFVDDSKLMIDNIGTVLRKNGYKVITAENGSQAYKILLEIAEGSHPLTQKLDCIITDVEMPLMDGFTLTEKVRKHPHYETIPIIMHSSLSGAITQAKVKKVGGSNFVVKNDLPKLLGLIKEYVAPPAAVKTASGL
jgi:two-component system chemotaxis response regulator CheV